MEQLFELQKGEEKMEKLKALSVDLTHEVFEGKKETILYVTKDDLFSETRYVFSIPSEFVSFEWLQSELLKTDELGSLINELMENLSREESERLVKIMESMMRDEKIL